MSNLHIPNNNERFPLTKDNNSVSLCPNESIMGYCPCLVPEGFLRPFFAAAKRQDFDNLHIPHSTVFYVTAALRERTGDNTITACAVERVLTEDDYDYSAPYYHDPEEYEANVADGKWSQMYTNLTERK